MPRKCRDMLLDAAFVKQGYYQYLRDRVPEILLVEVT